MPAEGAPKSAKEGLAFPCAGARTRGPLTSGYGSGPVVNPTSDTEHRFAPPASSNALRVGSCQPAAGSLGGILRDGREVRST